MKILHLIYDDPGNPWLGGGGSRATFEINRRLSKDNEITVLTGNFPGAKNETKEGIRYIRVGSGSNYLLSRLTYSLGVKKYLKSDYDLVIDDFSPFSPTHSYDHVKGPLLSVVRNYFGKQLFKKHRFFGFLPYFAEKRALKSFNNFLVFSPSMKKSLDKETEGKNIFQLKRGADVDLFKSVNSKEGDDIVFLGRISIFQKGLDILIPAFKSLKGASKSKLRIIGGGPDPEVEQLKALIRENEMEDRVILEGAVEGKQKAEILAAAKFVVIPSRYESWCVVAIEAAACGKAVVGMDIEGLCDSVKDGKTGVLASIEGDPVKNFGDAMAGLLKDNKKRIEMGEAGRKWAETFAWDNIIEEQVNLYKNLAKGGNK